MKHYSLTVYCGSGDRKPKLGSLRFDTQEKAEEVRKALADIPDVVAWLDVVVQAYGQTIKCPPTDLEYTLESLNEAAKS